MKIAGLSHQFYSVGCRFASSSLMLHMSCLRDILSILSCINSLLISRDTSDSYGYFKS